MADVVVNTNTKDPKELIGQGIRAYVLQDYNAAVLALGTASELLVKEHGDLCDSLGEVYLYYGKALLSLYRQFSGPLGDAIPKNTQDGDAEDSSEESVSEEKEGTDVIESEKNEKDTENGTEESSETVNECTTETTSETPNGTAGETANETTEEAGEDDDDNSDLEIAWEVLELAKKIFEKQGDEGKKSLGETLTVLGEISLESENFEAAINDIDEGIKIQKEVFGKDSRTIAESLYKLGMAYSTNSQIDEAVKCFAESLDYLRNRISYLETVEENKDETKDEIEEIKSLLPDIEEKIADMKTYKDETLQKIISAVKDKDKSDGSSTSGSSSSSSKPVTNISHLVKRKRKQDEVSEDKEGSETRPPKKPSL